MRTKKLNVIEKWINYNPIDANGLAVFRILFSFFCLLSLIGVLRIDTLTIFPSSFYMPQYGFAYLFEKIPHVYFLYILDSLNLFFLVGILFGIKTRWSSLLFGITFILSTSFIYAFSKIGHQHFIPFTAIAFSFSVWGERFSIDAFFKKGERKKEGVNVYPVFSLIIAFAFFTSGFSKILGGWLDLDFQAVRFYQIRDFTFVERYNVLTDFAMHGLTTKLFWEFMDYFIVIIEVLPLFVMFYPKVFRWIMFLLASFHLGVYLIMNISFGMYPLIYLPFIIDWKNSYLMRKTIDLLERLKWDTYTLFLSSSVLLFIVICLHYWLNFNGIRGLSLHRGIILVLSYMITLYFFLEAILLNEKWKNSIGEQQLNKVAVAQESSRTITPQQTESKK